MIGKIKMMAIITFYVAVLLVIAVYLQDGSGTFSHFFENANLYIRNLRNVHAPVFHQTYDNYLQLFPLILLFGLKLGGIRGNFGWKRLFTFIVLSVVLTQLVVNGLKLTTGVLRPDATNYFSFPSGHTAAAFMAATLLYKEYGFKGYWVGLVAYAAAIVTGFTRILNNRHCCLMSSLVRPWEYCLQIWLSAWYNSYSKTGDLYNINKYYKLNHTTN